MSFKSLKPAQGLGAGLFAGVTNVSMDQECSKHRIFKRFI